MSRRAQEIALKVPLGGDEALFAAYDVTLRFSQSRTPELNESLLDGTTDDFGTTIQCGGGAAIVTKVELQLPRSATKPDKVNVRVFRRITIP